LRAGLLLAALALFSVGMVQLLKDEPPAESPGAGITPARTPTAQFGFFNKPIEAGLSQQAGTPWCVGTYYAIAYTIGGVKSKVGKKTPKIQSSTYANPVIIVSQQTPDAEIHWYRGVEGVNNAQLVEHAMKKEVRNGIAYYIDEANPCAVGRWI
jgi:hypothetical protein